MSRESTVTASSVPAQGARHRARIASGDVSELSVLPDVIIGHGLNRDAGVRLGYNPQRVSRTSLELGRDANLRSGTVIYLGVRIGHRLNTGHGVIIREDCVLGD